jgi:AAA+ superfamily predicted ATPase
MNYHNIFYDDPQFINIVSLVQKKIKENPGNIIVLAGVSGGGKTSTAFGIATQRWSIYIDFSPSAGIYGDHVGTELDDIRRLNPKLKDILRQSKAFRILDMIILSRGLLLIKMLTENKFQRQRNG